MTYKIPKTMAAFDLEQDHLKTTRWDTPIWKKLHVLPSNHRVPSFPFMGTPSLAVVGQKAYFQLAKKSASQKPQAIPKLFGECPLLSCETCCFRSHIWICLISLLNSNSHISVIIRIKPTPEDPDHQKNSSNRNMMKHDSNQIKTQAPTRPP